MKQDWPEQHLEPHTDCVRKPKAAALLAGHPVNDFDNEYYVIMTLYAHTNNLLFKHFGVSKAVFI